MLINRKEKFVVHFFISNVYRNSFRTSLRRTFSISYLSIFDYFHGNVYPRTCLFCLDCCQLLLYRFFFSFFFFYTFCISHKARLIFITKNQLCLFNVPNFYPFYVYHQFYLSYFHVHNFFFTKFFFFFSKTWQTRTRPDEFSFSVAISFFSSFIFLRLMVCFYIPTVINILLFVIIIFFHLL